MYLFIYLFICYLLITHDTFHRLSHFINVYIGVWIVLTREEKQRLNDELISNGPYVNDYVETFLNFTLPSYVRVKTNKQANKQTKTTTTPTIKKQITHPTNKQQTIILIGSYFGEYISGVTVHYIFDALSSKNPTPNSNWPNLDEQ